MEEIIERLKPTIVFGAIDEFVMNKKVGPVMTNKNENVIRPSGSWILILKRLDLGDGITVENMQYNFFNVRP